MNILPTAIGAVLGGGGSLAVIGQIKNPFLKVAAAATMVAAGGLAGFLAGRASGLDDAGKGVNLLNPKKSDTVCDSNTTTGRTWCHEATELDYASESSALSGESSDDGY